MKWIRLAVFTYSFDCCYPQTVEIEGENVEQVRNMLPGDAEGDPSSVSQTYKRKPTRLIEEWAYDRATRYVETLGDKACKELASEYEICNIIINMVNITEIPIPEYRQYKPKVVLTEKISVPADVLSSIERLEAMKKRLPPKSVLEQIEYLEEEKNQESNKQRKSKIQDAINKLKSKYPALSDEAKEHIQKEIVSLKKKYRID